MRPAMILTILLATFLLPACMQKEPDMTALKKTADEFNNVSLQTMKSGEYEPALPYYLDDATWFAPNMAIIKGKEAIKSMMATPNAPKMTTGDFKITDLKAAGTIAYELGTYNMSFNMPDGKSVTDVGKYVRIWHQQQDGSWKVYNETWSSDLPAVPMPEPKKEPKSGKK